MLDIKTYHRDVLSSCCSVWKWHLMSSKLFWSLVGLIRPTDQRYSVYCDKSSLLLNTNSRTGNLSRLQCVIRQICWRRRRFESRQLISTQTQTHHGTFPSWPREKSYKLFSGQIWTLHVHINVTPNTKTYLLWFLWKSLWPQAAGKQNHIWTIDQNSPVQVCLFIWIHVWCIQGRLHCSHISQQLDGFDTEVHRSAVWLFGEWEGEVGWGWGWVRVREGEGEGGRGWGRAGL